MCKSLNINGRRPRARSRFVKKKLRKGPGEGQRQFQWVGGAQGKPFAVQFVCSGAWGGLWSFFGKIGRKKYCD